MKTIKMLQLTDLHLTANTETSVMGMNTQRSFETVMRFVKLAETTPDLIVITGDIMHDGSEEGYRRLAQCLDKLNIPVYCLPGNHDNPVAMHRAIKTRLVNFVSDVQLAGWQMIFLDSTISEQTPGYLNPSKLMLLERLMQKHSDLHTLVCLHHPPMPIGSSWLDAIGLENASEFFAIVKRYKHLKAILCGHAHQAFAGKQHNIRVFCSPSTSIQFKPNTKVFEQDDVSIGGRWLLLHDNGMIESNVIRIVNESDRQGFVD